MIASAMSAFHFVHRNRTYYLPFLITPQFLPPSVRDNYSVWLCVELLGHLLTILALTLFVIVVWKANALHINMIILNIYAIMILGGVNLLSRVSFIVLELGLVRMKDVADYIVPVHLVKFCAWLGIYHYVVYTTAERYAALRFAEDYESKRRIWVSAALIAINTAVTVIIATLLIFDVFNGAVYSALVCALSNCSCWVFSCIKSRSLVNEKRLVTFANIRQYSVSHRWQIKENIRLAKDVRFYVFGCAAQIMFYLPMFFVPPLLFGKDPNWREFLELSKACFQLLCAYGFFLAYVFCTLSIGRHVDFIRAALGLARTNNRVAPLSGTTQSPEEHFSTLSDWWT